ncbi:MAG: hypothetical protein ACYDDV_10250 [Methanoregula sp.]
MDFYLDTGTIYGRIDHTDRELNPCCISFFRKFPFKSNNFFTTKYIVEEELSNVRFKRTQGLPKTGREVERRARLILQGINNVEYSSHCVFKPLSGELESFLISAAENGSPKDHDAKLLTNAYLWEKNMSNLQKPHFVTTDGKDINNNKDEIQSIAEKHLACKTGLFIAFVKALLNN